MMYDVIIAGGGPAGLTAAIYACRGGLRTLILERAFAGGQMAISHIIDNYPGFENEVTGAQLAHSMKVQAQKAGAEILTQEIIAFQLDGDVKSITTTKQTFEAKTVILAMGAVSRKLGIAGEEELIGAGVSYCATCDGAFFKGHEVAVIGGGNTAVEDAIYLAKFCSKVYLIHRRNQFRAQNSLVKTAQKLENVEFVLESIPEKIVGENTVEALIVSHVASKKQRTIAVSGIFVAVGQDPKTNLISEKVELDKQGYIVAGEDCATNIEAVYCAGDIRTKHIRQIVTAAADGAQAATNAEQYIQFMEK
ncbi:MAG: thioredoxin-disulfide reductase [Christensenellaceae bacterium]